jgi:hypothetical protein
MSSKPTVAEVFVIIRKGVLEALDKLANEFKGDNFPGDKMVLHSIVSVAYSCAQIIDYPFERILAAHFTVLVKDPTKGHEIIREFYNKVEKQTTPKKIDKLLS